MALPRWINAPTSPYNPAPSDFLGPAASQALTTPVAVDPTQGVVGHIDPNTGAVATNYNDLPGGVPSTAQPTQDPNYGLGAAPDPNDLSQMGYDPEYSAIQRRLKQAFDRAQSQSGEDIAATQADIGNRRRNMQQQHPNDLRNLLENFAGRGMAYSGRYATDQGDMENQYAGALTGLDTEQAGRVSAIQRALSNLQADQNNTLEDAQMAYVRKRASQAEQYAQQLAAAKAADAARVASINGTT